MGGKQYAIGRARTVGGIYYPSFDTVAPLLEDYGCLHFKFSILLGVSAPTYSNRELEHLKAADNRKITFEGKEYTVHEATQIQRQLETKARHAKDRQIIAKAAGDEALMRTEQERINLITRKYKAFSDAAGLPVKTERMSVSGYHRVKTNAELVKNKVDNSENRGILKVSKVLTGHRGTPKTAEPNTIIDHKVDGKTDKRSFYGDSGLKVKDIHTTSHGNPKQHKYGENGEHAHEYEWDERGSLKGKITRELTEKEKKDNADIL